MKKKEKPKECKIAPTMKFQRLPQALSDLEPVRPWDRSILSGEDLTRLGGLLQALAGFGGAILLLPTVETGAGAVAVVVLLDTGFAGLQSFISGRPTPTIGGTITAAGIENALTYVGLPVHPEYTQMAGEIIYGSLGAGGSRPYNWQSDLYGQSARSLTGTGPRTTLAPSLSGVDKRFRIYAADVPPLEGYFDIAVHGDATGAWIKYGPGPKDWAPVSHRVLARYLKDIGYQGGPVRLISCETGLGIYPQNLANKLRANVIAPTDKVTILRSGEVVHEAPEGIFLLFNPKVTK